MAGFADDSDLDVLGPSAGQPVEQEAEEEEEKEAKASVPVDDDGLTTHRQTGEQEWRLPVHHFLDARGLLQPRTPWDRDPAGAETARPANPMSLASSANQRPEWSPRGLLEPVESVLDSSSGPSRQSHFVAATSRPNVVAASNDVNLADGIRQSVGHSSIGSSVRKRCVKETLKTFVREEMKERVFLQEPGQPGNGLMQPTSRSESTDQPRVVVRKVPLRRLPSASPPPPPPPPPFGRVGIATEPAEETRPQKMKMEKEEEKEEEEEEVIEDESDITAAIREKIAEVSQFRRILNGQATYAQGSLRESVKMPSEVRPATGTGRSVAVAVLPTEAENGFNPPKPRFNLFSRTSNGRDEDLMVLKVKGACVGASRPGIALTSVQSRPVMTLFGCAVKRHNEEVAEVTEDETETRWSRTPVYPLSCQQQASPNGDALNWRPVPCQTSNSVVLVKEASAARGRKEKEWDSKEDNFSSRQTVTRSNATLYDQQRYRRQAQFGGKSKY
ncbi:unnamed protein product [Protopolystoma xenopodis]|uniref:Uncharacterized protein n=1 Tax=Protopolystoma xenopodis TaxID=117903 RepID=A0A3S5ACZ9_9PLAT|nr:unnamed protein product [Protopolystoma xenopodis]